MYHPDDSWRIDYYCQFCGTENPEGIFLDGIGGECCGVQELWADNDDIVGNMVVWINDSPYCAECDSACDLVYCVEGEHLGCDRCLEVTDHEIKRGQEEAQNYDKKANNRIFLWM